MDGEAAEPDKCLGAYLAGVDAEMPTKNPDYDLAKPQPFQEHRGGGKLKNEQATLRPPLMNTGTSFFRLCTLNLAAAFIVGCASEEQASSAASIPYRPKPGKGLVILYRESTSIMREGWVGKIVNFRHL